MSRRATNIRNGIRGPTSALTDFLRSTGITPATVAQRAATRQEAQPDAGPSNEPSNQQDGPASQDAEMADPGNEVQAEAGPSRRRRARANHDGYASDELDEPASPPKKRKLTKAEQAKENAAAKKKKKDADDNGDDDAYTALSKSVFNSPSKPPNGSMVDCAKCGEQFTVTKYTMASSSGHGWLCHPCAKSSGADPFKKPAAPRKSKAAAEKRNVVHFEEKRFPSLVSLCVQVVSKHIDEVEALGDLGALNLQEIAKAIAKNRSLTAENVKLFYSVAQPSLVLFDATNLLPPAYETLSLLNPSLTSLRLDFCGQIDSSALDSIGSNLPRLTHLELLGPFLVKTESWQNFLKNRPLVSFKITQSPRFDIECLRALLTSSRDTLEELRLSEVGQLDDSFLDELKSLSSAAPLVEKKGRGRGKAASILAPKRSSKLRYLDLSFPSRSCSQDSLVDFLSHLGQNLEHLNLSGHDAIGDALFTTGIQPNCLNLNTLIMTNMPELTDKGIASFFEGWKGQTLSQVNLSRNPMLGSEALVALLEHSGATLEHLNINGWKEVSEEAVTSIGAKARELRKLDIGWCREVNDFVLKELIAGNETEHRSGLMFLHTIWVWGCGRVNGAFPRRRGLVIYGLEGHNS